MIKVYVTGRPQITADTARYEALVPLTAYDYPAPDNAAYLASTVLAVSGASNESLAAFRARLQQQADAWRRTFEAAQPVAKRLGQIERLEL